ncbi:phytanoyl-CoA dioxygenase family protein [Sorangium sp. So ce362]|uniref:phytanoyl-CoA dioxygenase family protein n=1 Tax=Sorangium sp. So ce362 TaxID=3133303 RepID=UPI003F600C2F
MRGVAAVFNDPARQAAFERDGFVMVDLLDEAAIAELDAVCQSLRHHHVNPFHSSIFTADLGYRWQVNAAITRVVAPRIAALTAHELLFGGFLVKQPARRSFVSFHQDWAFVDESRYATLTLWAPLRDVANEDGCLLIVPGSHTLNRSPRGFNTSFPYDALIPELLRRHTRVVPMRAGQAILFHNGLFHASNPNRGQDERRCVQALLAPGEAALRFHYETEAEAGEPTVFETYEVGRDFYTGYQWGTRPPTERRTAMAPPAFDPIEIGDLAQLPPL